MTLLIIIGIIVALLLWYALRGRAWLKQKPWAQGFFAFVEPIEQRLYQKSETMLIARLLSAGSFMVTAYDSLALLMPSLDWTPITNRLLADIPVDLRGMVVSGLLMGVGLLIAWLRKRTTKPLEVVALPQDAPAEVVAAAARVEMANARAIEVVASAKAQGTV